MRVLGIDPGLADVGWGVVERNEATRRIVHIAHGVIKTSPADSLSRRLFQIHREVLALIEKQNPEAVAVEELFFATNVKTAVVVAQGRGAAILAAGASDRPLAEYTPLEIKLAVAGHGRASKRQVQMMVRAILNLKELPKPDHAADALAVAICHLHDMSSSFRRNSDASADAKSKSRGSKSPDATDETSNPNKILLEQSRSRRRRRSAN